MTSNLVIKEEIKILYKKEERDGHTEKIIKEKKQLRTKSRTIIARCRTEAEKKLRILHVMRAVLPQAENNPGRKVYKKNPDVPFQPTEVPSPIYGFQSRESKLIHEIPAYQRKESKLQKEDEAVSSLEDTMMSTESLLRKKEELPTIDTGHHSDRKEADIFETADPSDKQQDTFSEDMILEQTHEVQQEISSTAEMLETEEDEVQETPPEPEEAKTETENDVTSQKETRFIQQTRCQARIRKGQVRLQLLLM